MEESRESAYELLKRGQEFLRTRNPAQAAVVLERAKRQEPSRPSIHEALGRAYYDSGNYEKSVREFKAVLARYPTDAYAHFCLAKSADKLGDDLLRKRHMRLAKLMGYENEG